MPEYEVFGRPEQIVAETPEEALHHYEFKAAVIEEPLQDEFEGTPMSAFHEIEYAHAKPDVRPGECVCVLCVKITMDEMYNLGFMLRNEDGSFRLRTVIVNGKEEFFYAVFKAWARTQFGIETK